MSSSSRGPKSLLDILGELFAVRGYNQLCTRQMLEDAWNTAVGEPCCWQTRLGDVRRGVLNVTVAHGALLEELVAFRKPALLKALRLSCPGTPISDIRFQVGTVDLPVRSSATVPPPPTNHKIAPREDSPPRRRTQPGRANEPEGNSG
jgi:predicted nucleic acid-binding Zn ribbon protein